MSRSYNLLLYVFVTPTDSCFFDSFFFFVVLHAFALVNPTDISLPFKTTTTTIMPLTTPSKEGLEMGLIGERLIEAYGTVQCRMHYAYGTVQSLMYTVKSFSGASSSKMKNDKRKQTMYQITVLKDYRSNGADLSFHRISQPTTPCRQTSHCYMTHFKDGSPPTLSYRTAHIPCADNDLFREEEDVDAKPLKTASGASSLYQGILQLSLQANLMEEKGHITALAPPAGRLLSVTRVLARICASWFISSLFPFYDSFSLFSSTFPQTNKAKTKEMDSTLRPVVLFMQHELNDTPAYLSQFLQGKGIDHVVFKMWEDSSLLPSKVSAVLHCAPREDAPFIWDPVSPGENDAQGRAVSRCRICAVCSTGGCMSANDDLPYYPAIFSLIRDCVATRTPYIGHCLGSQLLAVALGGKVTRAHQPECGWAEITPLNTNKWASLGIKNWFVDEPSSTFYVIHGETFSIPEGCHLIATGEFCYNQAFQVGDQYILGTQFHPEVTMEKIELMTRSTHLCPTEEEVKRMSTEDRMVRLPPSVMTQEALYACSPEKIEMTRRYSDHMYETWTGAVLAGMNQAGSPASLFFHLFFSLQTPPPSTSFAFVNEKERDCVAARLLQCGGTRVDRAHISLFCCTHLLNYNSVCSFRLGLFVLLYPDCMSKKQINKIHSLYQSHDLSSFQLHYCQATNPVYHHPAAGQTAVTVVGGHASALLASSSSTPVLLAFLLFIIIFAYPPSKLSFSLSVFNTFLIHFPQVSLFSSTSPQTNKAKTKEMGSTLRPVVLFMQHELNDTPAYLSQFLQEKGIDHVVFKMWEDSSLLPSKVSAVLHCAPREDAPFIWDPVSPGENDAQGRAVSRCRICAVCSTGGCMSANDDLPYYPAIFSLIRDCVATRTPYIGHCLGSQLLAVALGGKVTRAHQPECGWAEITPLNTNKWASLGIKNWFVDEPSSTFYVIHGETFSIPEGCHLIATGEFCYNQAFQVGDQYILGTQFHPEVTMEKIVLQVNGCNLCPTEEEVEHMSTEERMRRAPPSVMTQEALYACSPEKIEMTRRYSDHMYETWTGAVLAGMNQA
eukprot:gene11588-7983_t